MLAVLQQLQGRQGCPAVDQCGQRADAGVGTEAMTVRQQHHAVGQRCHLAFVRWQRTGPGLRKPGPRCRQISHLAAQIAENRTGIHRSELVAISQQDQPGLGRQGGHQACHHGQVYHRRFVHHQHIQRQRVAGMVAGLLHAGPQAQQAMQGLCLLR